MMWMLLSVAWAIPPRCLSRETPTQPAKSVVAAVEMSDTEVLARLVYAEAISTGFPDTPGVYRAIAWGTMNRVTLAARSAQARRMYGSGVRGVVFQPGQFNPAVSVRSRFAPLFLCPDDEARWSLAFSAASAAISGENNPFIQTDWEKEHGLSLVVNFYYPASVQARGPLAPWEDNRALVFLEETAPIPPTQVRFYRRTAPPGDVSPSQR